ncbi:hypothetical protein KY289_021590 [Solanum tuberosum]|nr:hypothetical protein KY289_021590 [Solanum tuberosum]
MQYPPGLELPTSFVVCRLRKSFYWLKQASRQWYSRLSSALATHGFVSSLNDYSLFFKVSGQLITIIAVDLGEAHYFLGIKLVKEKEGLVVTQRKFTLELLQEFNCLDCRVVSTPLDPNLKLSATSGSSLPDTLVYRRLLGKLKFLTNTRPDLSYAVQTLSQYMHSPHTGHLEAALHTLHYLARDPGLGLVLTLLDP